MSPGTESGTADSMRHCRVLSWILTAVVALHARGRAPSPRAPELPSPCSPVAEPELSSWLMVSFRTHGLGTLCAIVGILLGFVIRGHGSGQATPPAQLSAEDAKAKETFVRVCVKCHPVERVTAEGRSRSQWENTIVAMQTSRGAVVTPEEFDIVLDYLSKFHGRDAAAVAPAPGGPGPGGRGPRANVGAADRHRVDAAAVVRGQKIYASRMRDLPRCQRARNGTRREPDSIAAHVARSVWQRHRALFERRAPDADGLRRVAHRCAGRRHLSLHLGSHQQYAARVAGLRREERADRRSGRGPGVLQRARRLRGLPLANGRPRRIWQAVRARRHPAALRVSRGWRAAAAAVAGPARR